MLENTLLFLGEPTVPYWSGQVVEAFGKTDTGMVRESNQDSLCIDSSLGLYVVADGMGGRAGGEVASGLAVSTLTTEVKRELELLLACETAARRNVLARAINAASLRIYERSLELPQYRGMGTTTTLLWIPPPDRKVTRHPGTAIVAHVGDSRCYLLRSGLLYQVTDDHSLVNEQVKSGLLRKGDPLASQIRNVITRCVGYQEEEEVDTFTLPLFQGDRFLLCSDGLTGRVRDEEIAQAMGAENFSEAPAVLTDLANQRGGDDNITVVVVSAT